MFFPKANYWSAPLPRFVAGQIIERVAIRAENESHRLLQEQRLAESKLENRERSGTSDSPSQNRKEEQKTKKPRG